MTIDKEDKYYGAALIQIAEYEQFTAINSFRSLGKPSRCSFVINADIGIYLRYRSEVDPTRHSEFSFHFNESNLDDLEELDRRLDRVFIGLICDEAREVCCIPYAKLLDLITERFDAKGEIEDIYTILVTAQAGHKFRVYLNYPGKRNTHLQEPHLVARNHFPKCLFS